MFFGLVFIADFLFANLADKQVKQANFYFGDQLENASLSAKGGHQFVCQFGTVFRLYTYKTCFVRQTGAGYEKWLYTFHYARPFPILLGGRKRESYRFNMINTFNPIKTIYSTGEVVEMGQK